MKVLIAPDKFKGSLSALEACLAIEKGIKKFDKKIDTVIHPMADGGEGTLDILENYLSLETISLTVNDPLFRPVKAFYKKNKNTAFVEMATASGLPLLKEEDHNPLNTTTFGTGELISDAIKKGCRKIYLFVGGSATNDAGIGMAAALGYHFLDNNDMVISPIGEGLKKINKIEFADLFFDLSELEINVVCDVQNVLFGEDGAAYIYAPQKGADEKTVKLLDDGLRNISEKIKTFLKKDVSEIKGGGAAGGIAAGAVAFLGANILSGINMVMETTGFYEKIKNVDLVITGEGKFDKQTAQGKVVKGIADLCKNKKIPVAVLCGISTVEQNEFEKMGLAYCGQLVSESIHPATAMANASQLLEENACEMMEQLMLKEKYRYDT